VEVVESVCNGDGRYHILYLEHLNISWIITLVQTLDTVGI